MEVEAPGSVSRSGQVTLITLLPGGKKKGGPYYEGLPLWAFLEEIDGRGQERYKIM